LCNKAPDDYAWLLCLRCAVSAFLICSQHGISEVLAAPEWALLLIHRIIKLIAMNARRAMMMKNNVIATSTEATIPQSIYLLLSHIIN